MTHPFRLALIAPLLAALLLGTLPVPAAHAATFTVTNLNDAGAGSLRQAITDANAAVGADTITFGVSGTITLVSTLPAIADAAGLTIDGTGRTVTISGNNAVRVMLVNILASLTLNNLTIANGSFVGLGGGIGSGGTLTITNSTFSGNSATGNGGGIYVSAGTLTIANSTFSGNSTSTPFGGGGGIYNDSGNTLTITNSAFTSNSATGEGGGVYNNTGTLIVTNSTFVTNSALGATGGGGIYNVDTLTVTNSTFSFNSATGASGEGGGIFSGSTNTTVTNSTFLNNTAFGSGGGIYQFGGTLTVTNSTILNNIAFGSGGGIYQFGGTLTVTNNTFSGNSSVTGGEGGGIWNGGTLTVTNSTFSGNIASANGAGGGGIRNTGTLTIANSTFSANSAATGGGIHTNIGTATITNSTFSGNSAPTSDGGIANGGGGGTVTLRNTIVANNTGWNCGGTITNGGNNLQFGGTVANSCGVGIPTADPLLGALTGSPPYFPLNTGSPAIDAGSNAVCAAPPVNNTSQNGVTRPTDGDGNGTATCDIGSYEAPTAAGGGGGGGDPGPLVYLAVNGGSGYEFSVANPVAVTYQLRGCQGQEMFLILNAPPMGITWSYLNAAGLWVKLPANLADITPFSTNGPADGGSYNLFTGSVPPGDYELYLGCDFVKNGHLDYYLGGLNGVFDHILVHVR